MSTRSSAFLSCLALCGILAGAREVHADSDQVFADGFDGPKWYVDADSDTYGNPAVFVHSPSQPAGYVANALDCDDTNPAIHPGATDDPDASFADSNCDGIDGDIAKAVFVAPPGTDSPTCGTQQSPCHSPAFAIGRLSVQRTQIYLQVGVYAGALTVSANAAFYGGYGVSWQRGPVTAGGPNARLVGSITAMGTHAAQAHAVYVPVGIQALLADLEIDGPDTTATSNGNGANSYALYADQNANVQLLRDRIVAGTAANGSAGSDGVDAAQNAIATGGTGGPGMEYSSTCDATSHGFGANPSTNSCTSGRSVVAGKGGDGGKMDTACDFSGGCNLGGDCNATAGLPGNDAAIVDGTMGKGGSGGSGSGSCGATQAGFAGDLSDGSGGLQGIGSLLLDGQWFADPGGSGTLGDNGGGGGGGGGAGGCDTGTDSYGAGGGGGGAGGCAALGPGSGGGGGGGSFGVFAYLASVVVESSVISLGGGGSGGKGGAAGKGQPGGSGGPGGPSGTGDAPNGGKGGDGGRGGVAGGGGGGQGGSAYGIYTFSSSATSTGNTFMGGTAGSGGSGGASALGPGAGEPGQSGIVANVGICNASSACD